MTEKQLTPMLAREEGILEHFGDLHSVLILDLCSALIAEGLVLASAHWGLIAVSVKLERG